MKYPNNSILVVGQAKPSRDDAIYMTHGEFYISLVVERDSGWILDVESMFVGKNLKTDLQVLEAEIRSRYFALTQKPLIACMKDAYHRYIAVTGEN